MDHRSAPSESPLVVVSSHVTAIERSTGRTLWTHDLEQSPRRFSIVGERVFVLDADARLLCLALETGAVIGVLELGLVNANNLLRDGDRLYVSGDSEVVALDLLGKVLWRTRVPTNDRLTLSGLGLRDGAIMQPDFTR